MYSRSYNDANGEMSLPESYGGIALSGGFATEESVSGGAEATSASVKNEERSEQTFLGGMLDGFIRGSGISKLGNKLPFLQKIGSEEILIILAALFLFLSKEGDKECAAALILLLFIT